MLIKRDLRSERSLTQTAGRAARNINSKVIFYADKITDSMRRTMEETARRREKQMAYNQKHGITPRQIIKSVESIMGQTAVADSKSDEPKPYVEKDFTTIAADPVVKYMSAQDIKEAIAKNKKDMQAAVKVLDFIEAARLRDEIKELENLLQDKEK